MVDDMHGGIFDSIGDMNHDGKVDMQDYHLWQDVCEEPVISQILCKRRFRCKTEQNIFKAGAAQAASALPTK